MVQDLGRRAYGEVLDLQRSLCRQRIAGEILDDILLLVEHDPVVTLGRGARPGSLPLSPAELERRGIEVFEVERGGDVTFHGLGQLVGYPIIDLRQHREDLHWYLRRLEAGLITGLGSLGIEAGPNPGLTGVWSTNPRAALPCSVGVDGLAAFSTPSSVKASRTTPIDAFSAPLSGLFSYMMCQITPAANSEIAIGMKTTVLNATDQLTRSVMTAKISPIAVTSAGTTPTQIALFLIAVSSVSLVKIDR